MNDLITNINQAVSDFSNIKQAIIDKGVNIPNGTKTKEYGNLIRSIKSNVNISDNFLPHSEGLTYYFDVDNGVDLDKKVWRDQVQGLEIPMADTQNFLDAVTNNYFSFPKSEGMYAYTYYTVSRYDKNEPWKLIIGSYGTVPQFNLTNHNGFYGIDAGAFAGSFDGIMTPVTVKAGGQFTVNCITYQSGFGEWYCHRHSMTSPVDKYLYYASPNNATISLGELNNFKAIAIFKNTSQGRDLILENMAFLKEKFKLD